MMYLLKLLLYCFCLTTLNLWTSKAEGSFEDADQVNEFITMSFSSSHPYDLRQTIPGEPEIDYPIYSAVPKTNFDCNGRHEGYYADTEARCQVFRICANTDLVGKGFAFLCPNGTLFSQKNFVCDWYRNVDCNDSERYYSKNDNNRIGTKTDMMKTVRQMMEHPMKTISIALNRGKPTTLQPTTRKNIATKPTKPSKNFQTSSSPAISIIPTQDTLILENQSIDPNEDERAFGFFSPLPINEQKEISTTPSVVGFKPINFSALPITPPSPTFSPPFETPISELVESPLSSENISYDTYSSVTPTGLLLPPTDDTASGREVYISSLGELSTDPGANFNRQTSRVIAESSSNALDKPFQASGMNFAEKVNAGLNGLQVLDQDEIIAPEYVKNMMQGNVDDAADEIVQPVSFNFASNINSLLDEINYEAQLEGQNSLQFQQRTLQKPESSVTKKPFRFLSRGFTHDKSKENRSYSRRPTASPRRTSSTEQHSTSTQSYSNSLITTLLTTTQSPETTTEKFQILALDNAPENLEIESSSELLTKSEAVLLNEANQKISEVDDKSSTLKTLEDAKSPKSPVVNKLESVSEPKLESKPAIKREPKEIIQLDSVDSLKDISQETTEEDKVNANKRAEDLLLAGVKQITVNDSDEKNNTTQEETNTPIVPIYNRSRPAKSSTPHITSSSTTSTISTTTTSTTVPTTVSSSTTDVNPDTTPSTTSTALTTTPESTTSPAVSIRRFTVESGKRRQTARPISYSRRNNLQRSGQRSTSTTIKPSTTAAPTYRGRLAGRTTSTTSASITTKVTASPRRRLNVSRYTYGSRRRTTESSSSTSSSTTTTTTTAVPPSNTLNSPNSDSTLSDLTGAASTYNGIPNRSYNSIRQSSNKYVQTKRRLPSHKNITSQVTITTAKPSVRTSTTQQPTRSSPSLPTPTLAPFSYHDAISPMSTSSTTPEPLPATFLSFHDLTKSITDDSILQNLRKNQAVNRPLTDSGAFKSQQQALPRPQIQFSNQPTIQQEYSTNRPAQLSVPTSLPFIPLKDFIASKFGSQYSPEPPKLSTNRPTFITQPSPVQYTIRNPLNQNVFQQQSQLSVQQQAKQQQQQQLLQQQLQQQQQQRQQQQQQQQLYQDQQHHQQQQQQQQRQQQQQQQQLYEEQQLRLQQQQQKLQQLKQQQNHLQQQYQLQQQKQQQQQQYFYQQQMFPAQKFNQIQQSVPLLEQQHQKIPNQQHSNKIHQVSTKIIPSIEQPFQIQQKQPMSLTQHHHQRQQPQIQIIPSQMTVSQMILPQQPNINLSSNVKSEVGSINVRLPSNLAGLIPNTNIFELSRNSNSLESAQRRSDQASDDEFGARERKSVFAGVSSYDVPLSSVGRLTNDITNFLRRL